MNTESRVLCSTKYLQLKQTLSFNGKFQWTYAHRPNACDVVVIVPVRKKDGKEEILFLITQRPPLLAEGKAKTNIELPAGLVGDERSGESVQEAIEAELLEETGMKADKIKIVSKKLASSAGCLSETSTVAIAYIEDDREISAPVSDGGVILKRVWVGADDVYSWIKKQESNGSAISAQGLSGLFYFMCERH